MTASAIELTAAAKALTDLAKKSRKGLAVGDHEVSTKITVQVDGTIKVQADEQFTPTVAVPFKTVLALFTRFAGVTREVAHDALVEAMTEALAINAMTGKAKKDAVAAIRELADLEEAEAKVRETLDALPLRQGYGQGRRRRGGRGRRRPGRRRVDQTRLHQLQALPPRGGALVFLRNPSADYAKHAKPAEKVPREVQALTPNTRKKTPQGTCTFESTGVEHHQHDGSTPLSPLPGSPSSMTFSSTIATSVVAAATATRHAGTAIAAAKPCMVRGNGRQIDPGTDRRFMR